MLNNQLQPQNLLCSFPLYVEMITSSSKNAGMLQFIEDIAMVEVLHFSPGEFKPPTQSQEGQDHFQT